MLIREQFFINWNDVSSDTRHRVPYLDSVESWCSKRAMWLNPSAQGVNFVASLHLLETCVQPECYTPASSQAGKFWSPKASLVMLSFSGPSVMQWWPLLAVCVNTSWKTRGPAPALWKSWEDLGLIEEIEHATPGPEVVASLIGKQNWGL